MKRTAQALFLIACSVFALRAEAQKIGHADVELVLASMPVAQAAQKQLEQFGKTLEDRLATKEAYLNSMVEEYYEAKQANRLSPQQDETKKKELEALEKSIQESREDSQRQLLGKNDELMAPVLKQMREAIDKVAAEGQYTWILNKSASGNIIYGLESLDVTKLIAAKLGVKLPE